MTTLDKIKNQLIDRILVSDNEKLLQAIDGILDSTGTGEKVRLSTEQIEMLWMSQRDIEEGKLISEADLEKMDAQWMR